MGLLTAVLGLPLAPVRGLVAVAEVLRREADRELHDPAAIVRRLEDIAAARQAGVISESEAVRLEAATVRGLFSRPVPGGATTGCRTAGIPGRRAAGPAGMDHE